MHANISNHKNTMFSTDLSLTLQKLFKKGVLTAAPLQLSKRADNKHLPPVYSPNKQGFFSSSRHFFHHQEKNNNCISFKQHTAGKERDYKHKAPPIYASQEKEENASRQT